MSAKHTPGPYSLVKAGTGEYPAKNGAVMSCEEVVGDLSDLLEALTQARQCLYDIATAKEGERWGWDWESVISDADNAIAKARGEA